MADRMFPLIADSLPSNGSGPVQIPWWVAERAYSSYVRRYGCRDSLAALAGRGGFSFSEMDHLYPEWRVQVDELALLRADHKRLGSEIVDLTAKLAQLNALINSPQTENFLEAVRLEAAHQVERWGAPDREGKSDADWFWLIGYLGGKALHNPLKPGANDHELQLHRIITIAATALNWHKARSRGDNVMRPRSDPATFGLDGGSGT